MGAVAIVDTSIFCNVLDIPRKNGEHFQIMKELEFICYTLGNDISAISN